MIWANALAATPRVRFMVARCLIRSPDLKLRVCEENEEVQHQEGAGRLDSVLLLLHRSLGFFQGKRRGPGDSPIRVFSALQGGFTVR